MYVIHMCVILYDFFVYSFTHFEELPVVKHSFESWYTNIDTMRLTRRWRHTWRL